MTTPETPRALVTTSTFPRWDGDGTARFVEDLARLAAPAWDVTVLAPHHPGAARRERRGPLAVERYRYWLPESGQRLCYEGGILPNARASRRAALQVPALLAAGVAATRRFVHDARVDLVHAHFLVPQGLVAALALRGRRIPLVVSVHGSDLFALGSPLARRLQRAVIACADLVTVNGAATAAALATRIPAADAKIRELPMGFDPAVFHEQPGAGAPRCDDTIVFAGRLSHQKGVDVLVAALPGVLAHVPGASLRVIGDGPGEAALRAQVRTLRLEDRVTFLPAASQEVLATHFRSSALAVVPSRDDASGTEGLGLVAIEAMACGCPVVASRSGGLASLVGDDARGLAVQPDDPRALAQAMVSALLDREAARTRATEAARWIHERFPWQRVRPTLLAIYDEARARC